MQVANIVQDMFEEKKEDLNGNYEWEKHTKQIGRKLMMKMGLKQEHIEERKLVQITVTPKG